MRTRLLFSLLAVSCAFGSLAESATIYVDRQISPASCSNYAPASRACGSGTAWAYKTVSGAASVAVAGDIVTLRAGTYSERLVPGQSGTAALPITYVAYAGEAPTLSGVSDAALSLTNRSYIVIDGLTVTNVGGWGRLEDSSNNIIRNCTFSNATIEGTTGGLKLVRGSGNKVLNNTFTSGNDSITIQESDRNVIQGNTVRTARHSLLSLRCGNFNVIRGNTFSNPSQKDLEIYDCEGTSDAPVKLDATKRNLVENNVIADTLAATADYRYNGIQYGGQQGIVRRNVFRDNMGGAVNFQSYSDESLYNNRNRVYHNTFYGNRCYGVVGQSGSASQFFDNRVRNSVFYKNTNCSGSGGQTSIANTSQVILSNNVLATSNPGFTNETTRDFTLASGSSLIDAGAFLTTTASAGSGTNLPVADASYFYDGFQVSGQIGDLIQLQGQPSAARIVSINYTTNVLTLDAALTWTAGLGVSLAYAGAAPDLGAFEASTGAPALPQISVGDAAVSEGNSGTTTATFTVTLSPAATSTVTVNYATANGSATAGSDYAALSGTLTFTAGQTSKTVAVTVNGDTTPEPDETFVLGLSAPSGATLLDAQGAGTIANDDVLPTLSIGDVSVSEGNSGTKVATFTVTLSAASTSPVSATYATANGTATAGSDYAATGGTVTFPAGSLSQTLNVTLNGDTTVEPNETFTVTLSAPSGATLADGQATGTITNDDTAAVPTLSITDAAVTEGNSGTKTLAFTATLSASASSTVTVSYATANGTATAGSDYVAQNGTLTYTAGQTSKTVSVVINGDTTVEPNETFTVTLSAPSGATLADGQATGTITNDDTAAVPTLSITDASVTEGNSGTTAANFAVTLSAAASGTVTVGFSTANGTAAAGSDFTAQSGTLTFTAGQTSKTITVPVIGDATVENNETFTVTLSAPTGATLADGQGSGTIVNDDTTPPASGEDVVWTSLVGVAANGPSLTKTAATGWGTGGAISTKALISGNGYVEFTATETNTHRLLGLSNGNTNQNWDDIDFAIYLYLTEVKVYEKGALRGTFTSDATGDRFRVSVESGVVKYLKNGTVFYTSSGTLTYPLLVDTAFYSQGATVTNAFISGAWAANPSPNPTPTPTPPPSSGEALVWTSVVGASANGGTLTKTAATAWGNAGAVSSKTLPSGLNGLVEFTATQTNTHRILGLSNGDSNQSWDDIDFGLYLYASGPVQVYEKGVLKGTFGAYASGDKLQVAVESGVVKYKKNGVVLYSSASVPVFPLLVDSSLYSQGATFTSAILSGAWAAGTPPPPSSGTPVVWTSVVGASANGGTLTKTAGTAWGNAGAISNKTLASGTGSVEFTATETNTYRMLGLSNGNSSQNWDDIDFNLYLFNTYLQVYEKGVLKGTFGTYSSGDKLQVAVEAGVVKYKKNGVVFYTSTLAPVFPLLVDTALYSQGATLTNTVVSGTWQ